MKEIRFLLVILCSAIYTSSWWIASVFHVPFGRAEVSLLWAPPIIFTLILLALSFKYCMDNWHKKN